MTNAEKLKEVYGKEIKEHVAAQVKNVIHTINKNHNQNIVSVELNETLFPNKVVTDYCPNCGRKMVNK